MYEMNEPSTRPAWPAVFRNIEESDAVKGGSPSLLNPANTVGEDLHNGLQWLYFGMVDLEAGNYTDEAKAVIAGLQASVMISPSGSPVRMTNNTTLVLPAGLKIPDSTRTSVLSVSTDTNISILSTGVNALDTGAIATNSVYYLWIIRNPTTEQVGGLLSLSATTPTMPSGFTQKQLYPVDFQTETVSGNPRLIMKTLVSHQKAVFLIPVLVFSGTMSNNANTPSSLSVSTVVGNMAKTAHFSFVDGAQASFDVAPFYIHPSDLANSSVAAIIRLIARGDCSTAELPINTAKTYKMSRVNGFAVNIFVSALEYAPLA